MFAEYDLTPHHLPTIPDNPPPHEGAMINYPVVIEPPDLVLIEVLEALPGRPISGERLVRYDGMVSLGFYGEVHIAGLTLTQAKVKILQHLRRFLNDELLGLYDVEAEEAGERPEDLNARPPIDRPQGQPHDKDPFQLDQGEKPKAAAARPHAEHFRVQDSLDPARKGCSLLLRPLSLRTDLSRARTPSGARPKEGRRAASSHQDSDSSRGPGDRHD